MLSAALPTTSAVASLGVWLVPRHGMTSRRPQQWHWDFLRKNVTVLVVIGNVGRGIQVRIIKDFLERRDKTAPYTVS